MKFFTYIKSNPYKLTIAIGLAILLALLITQKLQNDQIELNQPNASQTLTRKFSTVGQTFVASEAGLQGIALKGHAATRCEDKASPCPSIILHLRASPTATTDLRQATASLAALTANKWLRFSFEPLPASRLTTYYFFIEPPATAGTLYYGPAESYLDGAMLLNGQPQEGQLTFYTVYNRIWIARTILGKIGAAIPASIAIMLLLILPGGALLAWLRPQTETDSFGWLTIAMGISLALFPMLFLLNRVVNGRLSSPIIWGLLGLSGILLGWRASTTFLWKYPDNFDKYSEIWWYTLTAVIVGLIIITRWAIIWNVTIPFWGDSVQHAVIAQRMIESGGLFNSWLPYTNFQTLTVHFGFHTLVALLYWLIGGDVPYLTLLAGQIFNVLAVLVLYPLAIYLSGKRWAGTIAILIGGLISPMPMYYVNWGRYSQLAGQAILPIALWLFMTGVSKCKLDRSWLLLAMVLAGMSLAYYRMPLFWVSFVGLWLIGFFIKHHDRATLWQVSKILVSQTVLTFVLLLPWILNVINGQLPTSVAKSAEKIATIDFAWKLNLICQQNEVWQNITFYAGSIPFTIAIIALLWGTWHRQWLMILPGVWFIGLALSPFVQLLPLPITVFMKSFDLIISIYIPVALLGGGLVGEGIHWLIQKQTRYRSIGTFVMLTLLLIGTLWGAWQSAFLLDRKHQMVFAPDEQAMQWIKQNTPPNAIFFVDGFTVYNDTSIVGADAGWWIPLLANRPNTMPPQYALLNEAEITPNYRQEVLNLVLNLRDGALASPQGIALLKKHGISYVYLGQAQGKVNNPAPIINPQKLSQTHGFDLVYHQDRVWIFALTP